MVLCYREVLIKLTIIIPIESAHYDEETEIVPDGVQQVQEQMFGLDDYGNKLSRSQKQKIQSSGSVAATTTSMDSYQEDGPVAAYMNLDCYLLPAMLSEPSIMNSGATDETLPGSGSRIAGINRQESTSNKLTNTINTINFAQKGSIRLERRYSFTGFVPSAIVPRIIAKMYSRRDLVLRTSSQRPSADDNKCWRSTFVQEYGDCTVWILFQEDVCGSNEVSNNSSSSGRAGSGGGGKGYHTQRARGEGSVDIVDLESRYPSVSDPSLGGGDGSLGLGLGPGAAAGVVDYSAPHGPSDHELYSGKMLEEDYAAFVGPGTGTGAAEDCGIAGLGSGDPTLLHRNRPGAYTRESTGDMATDFNNILRCRSNSTTHGTNGTSELGSPCGGASAAYVGFPPHHPGLAGAGGDREHQHQRQHPHPHAYGDSCMGPRAGAVGSRVMRLRIISFGHLLHVHSIVQSLDDYCAAVEEILAEYKGVGPITPTTLCPVCLMKQCPEEKCGVFFEDDRRSFMYAIREAYCNNANAPTEDDFEYYNGLMFTCPQAQCKVKPDFLYALPEQLGAMVAEHDLQGTLTNYIRESIINPKLDDHNKIMKVSEYNSDTLLHVLPIYPTTAQIRRICSVLEGSPQISSDTSSFELKGKQAFGKLRSGSYVSVISPDSAVAPKSAVLTAFGCVPVPGRVEAEGPQQVYFLIGSKYI
jgi:hypothetical protein